MSTIEIKQLIENVETMISQVTEMLTAEAVLLHPNGQVAPALDEGLRSDLRVSKRSLEELHAFLMYDL